MNAPPEITQINNNTPVSQDQETWIQLFASRLTACWPRLDANDAEHAADGLWREARWRSIEPTLAAERWMAQVMGTSTSTATSTAHPTATTIPTPTTPQHPGAAS